MRSVSKAVISQSKNFEPHIYNSFCFSALFLAFLFCYQLFFKPVSFFPPKKFNGQYCQILPDPLAVGFCFLVNFRRDPSIFCSTFPSTTVQFDPPFSLDMVFSFEKL